MTPSDGHDTIIHSPLTQSHGAEGHTLRIEIYRGADRPRWILEVIDDIGTSSVWDETFETDAAALDAAFRAFEAEGGVHAFVTSAQREAREAEPELMRRMDAASRAAPRPIEPLAALAARDPAGLPDLAVPLTPAERDELDRRLMDFDNIDGMTLDMVDGFLHALAIGPLTLPPVDWLPQIWGQAPGEPLPALDDIDEATHLMGLVLRHFNGIVDGLDRRPPQISPLCQGTILLNGERPHEGLWARGFHLAVQLAPEAWQPLLDDPDGRQWYRPIHLLGGDPGTPEVDAVRDAFELRLELAAQIAPGLLPMHAFWLPVRQALAAGVPTRRPGPKVGRNDPCPCGSGKKYKKCCGAL